MNWLTATLGDICDQVGGTIRTGPFGSQLHESDYVPCGIPVVMPKNIIDGRIDTTEIAKVSEETAERLSVHKMQPGDIVYGRRGDIGRRALIKDRESGWLCGTGCLRISLGNTMIDPAFLFYYLGSPDITAWIRGQAIGATLPNLNTSILRSVPVVYPTLPTQRKIADILSAYDDLIKNNTRRIAILEEMAQRLYREWFVHFRYPGHESVPLVDSELGPIPEGWEVKRLSDLVTTQYGFTESASESPVGPKFLRGMDINKASYINWDSVPYCPISPSDLDKYRLAVGDLLVIRMADPGKIGIVEEPVEAVFASYLVRLKVSNRALTTYYLFYFLTSGQYQGYITGASTGTTRKSASSGVITGIDLVLPPTELAAQFDVLVGSFRNCLNALLRKNSKLRNCRDLLLTHLLQGALPEGRTSHAV